MATEALLEVEGLERSYDGKVLAVDGLTFSMDPGRVVGFIGPNGAGKTTTMRILATLDLPDKGDARICGESVLIEPRKVRDRVGFMSDHFQPYSGLDVMQFLDFFARANGLVGRERIATVRSVAGFCGLDEFATRPATGLSKGMGQRLHLAKTLLHDPALLILDEPASGLDPRARIEFRELLRALADDGKGILISSHILVELSETCDDVVVLEQGKLVTSGSIDSIAQRVQDRQELLVRVVGDSEALAVAQRFFVTQPHVDDVLPGESGVVRFAFAGDDDALADLLGRAVAQGIRIAQFTPRGVDLEAIFMQMTEGRLQ